MPMHPDFAGDIGIVAESLLDALRAEFPATEVHNEPGCWSVEATCPAYRLRSTRQQRLMLWCWRSVTGPGCSGRNIRGGLRRRDLNLPGHQPELVEAILQAGRPTVLLAVSGRPYALGQYQAERQQSCRPSSPVRRVARLWPACYLGGSTLRQAAGRVPRHAGGQPHTYLAPPLGQNSQRVSSLDPTPAFPFGHGLSYTSFSYENLRASATSSTPLAPSS